jgi:seryl-tRNA synthetase
MNTKVLISIAIVSILICGCVAKSDYETALAQIDDLETQITEKETTIDTLEAQNQSLSESLDSHQSELDDLNTDYEVLSDDYQLLIEDNETLQEEYSDTKDELWSAYSQLNKLICDQTIDNMVYENIFDVSNTLADWWLEQPSVASVRGTYRDHIWSNADTKIHAVMFISANDNQPYVEHFLVYFDEFGMKPGVFWVGGQCWLNVP